MEDILLSQKQYQALMTRLDNIKSDVKGLTLKTGQETAFIDNYELSKLLKVTIRSLQRWRKSGRLPYLRIGKRIYYRVDVILNSFKVRKGKISLDGLKILSDVGASEGSNVTGDGVFENDSSLPENLNQMDEEDEMACKRCPLYLILNSKG